MTKTTIYQRVIISTLVLTLVVFLGAAKNVHQDDHSDAPASSEKDDEIENTAASSATRRLRYSTNKPNNETVELDLFFWGNNENPDFQIWSSLSDTGGPVEQWFRPTNNDDGGVAPPNLQDSTFLPGLESLQAIVAQALSDGKRVRAHGRKFSMNNMPYTSEYMVDTTGLNYCKILDAENDDAPYYVHSNYTGGPLVFVQAGVRLKQLHARLESAGLALPTYCYPDGVTLVGATLTGSHGSLTGRGSMEDIVRAVHLVTDSGHYLVQRQSELVVTEAYASFLGGAMLVSDDALFDAVVVSFGAFGLVHGMLVEVEPYYELKMETKRFNFDDVKDSVTLRSLNKLELETTGNSDEVPYHIMFVANVFQRNQLGFYVQVLKKLEWPGGAVAATMTEAKNADTNVDADLFAWTFLSTFQWLPAVLRLPEKILYGFILSLILSSKYHPQMSGEIRKPSNSNTFPGSDSDSAPFYTAKITSVEVMVSSDDAPRMMDIMLAVADADPTFTDLSVRYALPTRATLGPMRFAPYTAAVSMAGVEFIPNVNRVFDKVFAAVEASGIRFTHHWGKRYPLRSDWVAAQYEDALEDWLDQRDSFLTSQGKYMFSNQMMEDMGLNIP